MTDHLPSSRSTRPARHPASAAGLSAQPAWRPRVIASCVALSLLAGGMPPALAQLQRKDAPATSPRIPGNRSMSTELNLAGQQTTADYIVAVVNSELITHTDVDKRVSRILDTAQRNTQLPPADELRSQVLDALIDEKVQISFAKNNGIDVGESEIDGTIESIASQNQLSLAELRQRMESDGLDFQRYRASLKEQILLQRVREREVIPRIKISDEELDAFIASDPAAQAEVNLNVAHILIAVPEGATAAQVQALQAKAQALQESASRGANFGQLAKDNSADKATRDQGGGFGMRPASKLPDIFVNVTKDLKVGQVAPLVRSNAGFHIVKLIERENSAQASYTEQRARHILLRTTPQQPPAEQIKRLSEIRKQIIGGQGSFAQMARQYSEDGSAAKGGDLGWAAPGQFVPEFEKAMVALQPGQISEPIVSRFGVHLIQLIERREVKLTDAQQREAARAVLRERKFEPTYEEWARELRAAAYVEMRDAP
ncbi:peptidylprolyl isomerase [Aquabacterium sp.]|uniref:peptidylprolyl isomerase n=1 Tax=Aquabacterium sp. TaxID=1872578 RepID=UPI0025C49CA8|nr:peptidylprolyl isomerase [Aquabacterium sp.]